MDFNLLAGQNSKRSHSDESSYSASVGASASVGVNGAGYGLNANGSIGFGNGKTGSTTWAQSTIEAANFTLKTGGNANITGSAVKSDKVKAKIGGDLIVTSLQDEHYHNKKNDTVSIGGSYGASGVSFNGSYSQDRTNSSYSSVTNQAGIFAGNEGFDIEVGGKTTLTGAVIASSAEDKTKNRLSTQTISYSDITNKAEYSVNSFSAGAGYGTGGVNISAPSTYHHGDDDASKTKSAVEMGALIVRDEQNQTQLVSELSHDTKGAHKELKQIFDEEKELERKRTLALVSEAAQQAKTFKTQYDKVEKKYANTDNDTNNQGNKNQSSGTGSTFNKRVDQVASIVTRILTGDVGAAASGVLAPEVANLIKRATYEEDENGNQKTTAANILAHAAGGAALAGIAGGDVLAGAGAAAGGEIIAGIVRNQLYAGKTNKELTEADKQNISNAAQLLTGLGAGLASANDGNAIETAVASSKNAVENNFFNLFKELDKTYEKKAVINCYLSDFCGNDGVTQDQEYAYIHNERLKDYQKTGAILQETAEGLLLLSSTFASVGTLGAGLITNATLFSARSALIGAVANSSYQFAFKPINEFDYKSLASATILGGVSTNLPSAFNYSNTWSMIDAKLQNENMEINIKSNIFGLFLSYPAERYAGPYMGSFISEFVSDKVKNKLANDEGK